MTFKKNLTEILENKIPLDLIEFLPNGFQKIGNLVVLNLRDEVLPFEKEIGQAVLKIVPLSKTVVLKTGEITGELRRPQIKIIAGENSTYVEHFENGVWFCFDAEKIMFAKGNVSERGRLAKLVLPNEVIVDMFVGIGYFSVPIAKLSKVKKIYGIDLNPDSIFYLKKTIEKNKIKNIEVICGDSKTEVLKLVEAGIVADRVLLGYLPPPKEFIPYALKILKKGGFVHYDALIRTDKVNEDIEEVLDLFRKCGRQVELINAQRVKSYRPKVDHYVLDLKVL